MCLFQEWIEFNRNKFFVLRSNYRFSDIVVFTPGLGQSATGSYYLYSQIMYEIADVVDVLSFDFLGFGDSDLDSSEINYKLLNNQLIFLLNNLKNSHNKIYFVLNGSSCFFYKKILENRCNIITIEPIPKFNPENQDLIDKIYIKKKYNNDLIDTSQFYDNINFINFMYEMGASYNEGKGLYLKSSLIYDLINEYKNFNRNIVIKKSSLSFLFQDSIIQNQEKENIILFKNSNRGGHIHPLDRDIIKQKLKKYFRKRDE